MAEGETTRRDRGEVFEPGSRAAHGLSDPDALPPAPGLMLATRNPAKAEQLRRLCHGLAFQVVDGCSFPSEPEVQEDAASHLGNAVQKAVAWSRLHGGLALSSDGGLAIPALGGDWSSLVTRRGTGGSVSDQEHATRLLRRMRHLGGDGRRAHWVEAVAVARNGVLVEAWEASGLFGTIADAYVAPEGGLNGFWVSGLWVTGSGRRHWELGPEDLRAELDPWETLAPLVRGLLERLAGPR